MFRSCPISAALLSLVLIGVAPPAAAQAEPDPQAESIVAGQAALARARSAYIALESYSDRAVVTYIYQPKGERKQEHEWNISTRFVAPASLHLTTEDEAIITDGEHLYKVLLQQHRFTRERMPSEFDSQAYISDLPSGGFIFTPAAVLLLRQQDSPEQLLRVIQTVTGSEPAAREGVPGLMVTARGRIDADDPRSAATQLELFFRDEDGLLGYMLVDATDGYRHGEENQWERVAWSYEFTDIQRDVEIDGAAFAPPEGLQESDDLLPRPAASRGSQTALIGLPAPVFEGEDQEGKPLKLADFEGRVVILDFWAMWCAPCVAALPHVQGLHERFADKPVTVLGMNLDRRAGEDVAAFANEKGITFRHFMDDGSVSEEYRIRGIPAMVIIDQQGIVQDVSTGFGPGKADLVAGQIEKLLAGESLRTDEELAELRTAAEAEASRPALSFESHNRERLATSRFSGARTYYSRHSTFIMDAEGSGKRQIVNPGNDGEIEIIDAEGNAVQRIRFQGLGRGRIESVAPIQHDGGRHWLIAFSDRRTTTIGLYTDSGERIWTYIPELPEATFVQALVDAGDVTGDGSIEYIAGLSATRRGEGGGLDFGEGNQAGAVIILGADGTRLAQRATGPIDFLFITQPDEGPASILVSTRGRLGRMAFEPEEAGMHDTE